MLFQVLSKQQEGEGGECVRMDYRLNFLKPSIITEHVTCQRVITIIIHALINKVIT